MSDWLPQNVRKEGRGDDFENIREVKIIEVYKLVGCPGQQRRKEEKESKVVSRFLT